MLVPRLAPRLGDCSLSSDTHGNGIVWNGEVQLIDGGVMKTMFGLAVERLDLILFAETVQSTQCE